MLLALFCFTGFVTLLAVFEVMVLFLFNFLSMYLGHVAVYNLLYNQTAAHSLKYSHSRCVYLSSLLTRHSLCVLCWCRYHCLIRFVANVSRKCTSA